LTVCLSVNPHDISKTSEARIAKLDVEMFHHESVETHLFWGQKVKGQGHDTKSAGVGFCTLVSAG